MYVFPIADSEDRRTNELMREIVIERGEFLEIGAMYAGPWNEVCVLSPYAASEISTRFGKEFPELWWNTLEGYWGLAFFLDGVLVLESRIERKEIDFDRTYIWGDGVDGFCTTYWHVETNDLGFGIGAYEFAIPGASVVSIVSRSQFLDTKGLEG